MLKVKVGVETASSPYYESWDKAKSFFPLSSGGEVNYLTRILRSGIPREYGYATGEAAAVESAQLAQDFAFSNQANGA